MCVSNMLSFANSLQTHKYCQSCPVLKGVHWTNSNSASMALRHKMYPLEICAVVSWQSMQNLLFQFLIKVMNHPHDTASPKPKPLKREG